MFLTFQAHKVSPLSERAIHINVYDIVSLKTASVNGEILNDLTEIKLRPNRLVNTEDNERGLTYIWVHGESNGIKDQVNQMLSDIRQQRI
jgi:hypothetical protein